MNQRRTVIKFLLGHEWHQCSQIYFNVKYRQYRQMKAISPAPTLEKTPWFQCPPVVIRIPQALSKTCFIRTCSQNPILAAEQRPAIARGETVGKLVKPFKPRKGERIPLFCRSCRSL